MNKKVKRFISKGLVFSVFMSNISISSFAGILSEDTRYETFEDENVQIENVLEEDSVTAKLEGNTLVNLAYDKFQTGGAASLLKTKETEHELSVKTITPGSVVGVKKATLKDNTTYTLICDLNTNLDAVKYSFKNNENYVQGSTVYDYGDYTKGYKKVVTTVTTTNNCTHIVIGNHGVPEAEKYLNIKNLMLLEGDWTNASLPSYFYGLKSSFEEEVITQEMVNKDEEKAEKLEKYKVDLKSTGKNLFIEWRDGGISAANGSDYDRDDALVTDFIPINSIDDYYVSGLYNGVRSFIAFYDSNYNYIRRTPGSHRKVAHLIGNNFDLSTGDTTYYIPKECSFVRLTQYGVSSEEFIAKDEILSNTTELQIEKGSAKTEYESYKQSEKVFYLNSPLLEGDTIEYINNQVYHVKRSGRMILDGSSDEDWFYYGEGSEDRNGTALFSNRDFDDRLENTTLICDKFKVGYRNVVKEDAFGATESLWGHNLAIYKDHLYFRIDISKLATQNLLGFKQWLSNNPITVVYQLAEPIYEPISTDLSVQLFKDTTYISTKSTVPVNIKVIVDRVANRAQEYAQIAKENPTVENIALARMWANLMKDSVLKDEFQESINSIVHIEDLELEKKKVSANLDLYIQSENTLSMSLSTNSVMFEDYTGTDELEMLKAVDITVNSSLPYDLNVSMPEGIYNSDKSNYIDTKTLNIRENTESQYRNFADINTKIELKSNCAEGNNNIHSIDLKLSGGNTYKADVYKTVLKFEVQQK